MSVQSGAACPHCNAPQPRSRDEYTQCSACEKWYRPGTVERLGARAAPGRVPPSKPKPSTPLNAAPYDPPTELPADLVALGFKLVHYADKSAAVSSQWGCSESSANLDEIVRSARNIVGFVRWMKKKGYSDSVVERHEKGLTDATTN